MSEPATTEPTTTEPRAPNAAAAVAEVGTSNNVYIRSEEYAWIPARVVDIVDHDIANVSLPLYKDEQLIQSDGGKKAIKFDRLAVKLTDYANKALPLQNVDENGMLNEVEDMVDLPFLHEVRYLTLRCSQRYSQRCSESENSFILNLSNTRQEFSRTSTTGCHPLQPQSPTHERQTVHPNWRHCHCR